MATPRNGEIKQIVDAQRARLPSVLKQLGIDSELRSTQFSAGAANYASSVIFTDSHIKQFAEKHSSLLANSSWNNNILDHEFFFPDRKLNIQQNDKPYVTFLHSYAGHASYKKNIPTSFHLPLSPFFQHASATAVFGTKVALSNLDSLQEYDNAMRYIDSNLAFFFEQIANKSEPTIAIYFSDHGDSLETAKLHDAAAYQIEMTSIPFLLYFNEAARAAIPRIFEEFKQAESVARPATLEQLSATVLRLLGFQFSDPSGLHGIGLDSEDKLTPIHIRKTARGLSYIRTNQNQASIEQEDTVDDTDAPTNIWINSKKRRTIAGETNSAKLCYDNANSFAKAMRGALVSDCLSINVDIDQSGKLFIQPQNKNTAASNWLLTAIKELSLSYKTELWINASSADEEQVCNEVKSWLNDSINEIRITLQMDAKQDFPPACQAIKDNVANFFINMPKEISIDNFEAWLANKQAQNWPSNISLTSNQLEFLNNESNIQWAVKAFNANDLPWQDTHLVEALIIDTRWDINTR